jgi:uncharacterized protein
MLPRALMSVLTGIGHAVGGVGGLATAVNTIAGGGFLILIPALAALGLASAVANAIKATRAFALADAMGYLRARRGYVRGLVLLGLVALAGTMTGSWLLLQTTDRMFNLLVPVLVFVTTILLALRDIKPWQMSRETSAAGLAGIVAIFAISLYGGYLGAGMGISIMAFATRAFS